MEMLFFFAEPGTDRHNFDCAMNAIKVAKAMITYNCASDIDHRRLSRLKTEVQAGGHWFLNEWTNKVIDNCLGLVEEWMMWGDNEGNWHTHCAKTVESLEANLFWAARCAISKAGDLAECCGTD